MLPMQLTVNAGIRVASCDWQISARAHVAFCPLSNYVNRTEWSPIRSVQFVNHATCYELIITISISEKQKSFT